MAKRKGNTALTKITAEAKRLQRQHPNTKWVVLIKQASAKYRNGSLGAVKFIEKGESKKTKVKKTYRVKRSKKGLFQGVKQIKGVMKKTSTTGSINGLKSKLREKLERQLGEQYIKLNRAKLKRMKKKIQKRITSIKSQLRKFA